MADKKLSQIDEATSAKDTDYIHVVIDNPTTPVSRRIKKRNFLKANAAVVEKTADFTVTAAEKGTVFLVESASPVTITLPDSATTTLPDGYNFTVKTTGNGAAVLTKAGAADGINGNATIRTGQAAGVVKHGTSPCTWEIFGNIEISAIGKTGGTLTAGNLGKFDGSENLVDANIAADDVVTPTSAHTLTNKAFNANGAGNSLTNVEVADIAGNSKSGQDSKLITGTAGSDNHLGKFNSDGDLVDAGVKVDGSHVMTGANIGINTQAGAYTLTADDNNRMILLTAATNVTLTIPEGTSLPVGFNCSVKNSGTGTATVQCSGGDTLTGATEIKPGYTLGLVKTEATKWHSLGGDLVGTIQIGEIDSSAKSGKDATLITGTAGSVNRLGKFNSDSDLIGTGITVDDSDKVTGANVDANTITGTTYTLQASDNNKVLVLEAPGNVTLTLAATLAAGFNCVVKYTGSGTATVTSTQTITGTTGIKAGHTLGIAKLTADTWHTFGGILSGSVGIGDINNAAKSGADLTLITGTAGSVNRLGKFNGDGDLIGTGITVDDSNIVTGANVGSRTDAATTVTLSATDNNAIVVLSANTPVTVNLPGSLVVGFNCVLKYTGNGSVSFSAAGQTITGKNQIDPGHSLGVVKTGSTVWHTFGGGLLEALGIDAISSAARSGIDAKLITGTAGTDGTLSRFNADGDLVGTGVAVDDDNVMTRANAGINLQTTNYTLAQTDNNRLIVFNSAAAVTLTLPQHSALALPTGFNCTVKNINTGDVTLQKQGTDTISGATTVKNGQSAGVIKRGTAAPHTWEVLGGNRQRIEVFAFIMRGRTGNDTYRLVLKVPFAGIITETVTKSKSGTATAQFKIGDTNLGGTVNAVSSTRNAQAHTTNNAFSAGDDIEMEITGAGSGNSRPEHLAISIKYTRDL